MVVPHVQIPLHSIRPSDITFLLVVGTITELLQRLILRSTKVRSKSERNLREKLRILRYETNQKRALGPSAFVETAKLERKVLASEKELSTMEEKKKAKVQKMEKALKYVNYALTLVIFAFYYGVAMITVDGLKVSLENPELVKGVVASGDGAEDAAHAAALMKGVLFPISYIGLGMKLSRFGLASKYGSVGALVVYWSAQVMTGKVYECLEALTFR